MGSSYSAAIGPVSWPEQATEVVNSITKVSKSKVVTLCICLNTDYPFKRKGIPIKTAQAKFVTKMVLSGQK